MSEFYVRWPQSGGSGGGGVTTLNGESGAVVLVPGTGISITPAGQNITISNTESAFTPGNLTDAGTDGITITNGTNAVNGAGTSIAQHVADSTHNGYLASADWTTFNNKQPAGSYANTTLSNLGITSINTNLLPSGDNLFTLGSNALRWDDLHTTSAEIGELTVTQMFSGLIPNASNSYDLGSTSFYWQHAYLGQLVLNGSTSGTLTQAVPSVTTSYSITWPGSQGASNTVLTNNGSGGLTWVASGSGTVTSVSVVSANGLAGTVATATTTPAITLSTTITGILQGNGTAISAATTGDLTDAGTDGITITSGTGAVLGSGTSISQHVSDATHNGYLSSADWSTFNAKQAAGSYITALTGDVTASGPGSSAASLVATTNSTITTLSALSLPGSQVTGDISGNAANITGTVAIANGGTGQTSKAPAFDALSPMTTGGDIIFGGTSGTGTRLANGSLNQVLTSQGGTSAPIWQTPGVGNFSGMAVALTSNYTSSGGSGSPIKYDTVLYDTAAGYSTGTGLYTVPDTAMYHVSVIFYTLSGAQNFQLYKNGTGYVYILRSAQTGSGSVSISCTAGDTLSVAPDASSTYDGNVPYLNILCIEQIH